MDAPRRRFDGIARAAGCAVFGLLGQAIVVGCDRPLIFPPAAAAPALSHPLSSDGTHRPSATTGLDDDAHDERPRAPRRERRLVGVGACRGP